MAHIDIPSGAPGIMGLMRAYPETAAALNRLAEALLRSPSSLSALERELIGTYVSSGNECGFCTNAHAATARVLFGDEQWIVDAVLRDPEAAPISGKLKALLHIAEKVRSDARSVDTADIERARDAGADDRAIHDTVLIAAAFCMFNRYVDGLGTSTPGDLREYAAMGNALASRGYGPG
jgi:uncharacterized peroxidase-related enzyme